MHEAIIDLAPARRGHFLLESGHHSDLWLDIELLFLRPRLLASAIAEMVEKLRPFEVEVVCGPLNEGAFVALLAAERLGIEFCYSERVVLAAARELFPFTYCLPPPLRERVAGRRVAIVNDVTNAGSAVRGTYADLRDSQAIPVVIASLVMLGETMAEFAAAEAIPLLNLTTLENQIWTPAECPLCAASVPLTRMLV